MRTQSTTKLAHPICDRDHIWGPTEAPVTLVEYGDYECPYCGEAYVVMNRILDLLGDDVTYVYRHFPMTTVHPHAALAAEAAEAAGAQGKFWAMHQCLFENQDALGSEYLVDYAEMIGLNVPKFTQDLAKHRHAGRVREHFLSGVRSGVNGTPTFFINGERHDGSWDVDSLLAAIQGEIEESD
jgi:protein-disulfide isomerase